MPLTNGDPVKTTKFTSPAFYAPGIVMDAINSTGHRIQIVRNGEAELSHTDGSTFRTPQQFLNGFPSGVVPTDGTPGWTWAATPHFTVITSPHGGYHVDTEYPKAYADINEAMREHGLFTATVYAPHVSIEVGVCVETLTYHYYGVVIDDNHAAPDETWLAMQATPFRPEALEPGYPWIKLLVHGGQKALVPLYDVVAVEPFVIDNSELGDHLVWNGTGYNRAPDTSRRSRRYEGNLEIVSPATPAHV